MKMTKVEWNELKKKMRTPFSFKRIDDGVREITFLIKTEHLKEYVKSNKVYGGSQFENCVDDDFLDEVVEDIVFYDSSIRSKLIDEFLGEMDFNILDDRRTKIDRGS